MTKWPNLDPAVKEYKALSVKFLQLLKIPGLSQRYKGSREGPDLMIRPGHQALPSVVFESGWSESAKRMEDAMNF